MVKRRTSTLKFHSLLNYTNLHYFLL